MNKSDSVGPVTIYQIAAESGVSVSTVSRVLNNSPRVSPKTLERVNAIIDKYSFKPSPLARAMINNRTETLGVIMPDITSPYFSSLFLEIERHALEHKYSIILCNTLFGGSSHGVATPFGEMKYFQMMMDKKVDGVIITGGEVDKESISREYVDALNRLNNNLPVIVIGQDIENCNCLFINRNLGGGVSSLIQHLAALNHHRIGFIGGEPGVKTTTARLTAYRNTLKSLSLPYDPSIVALSDYYFKDGYSAMKQVLDQAKSRPTAVVAINDMVAIGAIRVINDYGLHVPEDIAIVSCDQFFESEYLSPRLTTLDQQNDYLGKLAIMMLLCAINGMGEPVHIDHNPRLIIRESCGSQLSGRK